MKISTDFALSDCPKLGVGGTSGKLYIIDYDDWLFANKPQDADFTYTSITLTNSGAKATEYLLTRSAITPTTPASVNVAGKSGWNHTLTVFLPFRTQVYKSELASYMNCRRAVLIVVMEGEDIPAEVYGSEAGVMVTTLDENPADQATGGGITVTFATPDDMTLESLPPLNYIDTDRATTLAALEAMKTPVA